MEHGGLEAEALAAGGGGGDDDVLALQGGVDGGGLVRVEGPAAKLRQPRFEGGVQRVLEGLLDGVAGRQGAVVDHLAVVPRLPAEPVEEGLDVHGGSVARGLAAVAGPGDTDRAGVPVVCLPGGHAGVVGAIWVSGRLLSGSAVAEENMFW